MLEVRGVCASYGQVQVLEDVSLAVPDGRIVCLLGANGAGKTTLINVISGVVPITGGSVTFGGTRLDTLSVDRVVDQGVVQVPEGREIFPDMSVLENILLGAWTRRNGGTVDADLDRVYTLFPRLKDRVRQKAGTLSGGEQQMLMIGRALMAHPRILLLDEPSLGLSPLLIEEVFATIMQLNRDGLGILVVEQNAQLALSISQHGYILENGEMVFQGPSSELIGDPKVQEAYLGM